MTLETHPGAMFVPLIEAHRRPQSRDTLKE